MQYVMQSIAPMARFKRIFACLLQLYAALDWYHFLASVRQLKIQSKKMSAPREFAPAANATNHATTTNEQTASASRSQP
ncbi:hypothetical protein PCANC_03912 [Puccinia coronata f. sp. avenae]|uniref:Uncharacterized protein n=1 Tax=Puccinia coronata f. sp. avenae TaxID=200324 RepID=A0A2N5W1C5_9BASI|nr:hypothetical protein PCANC_03912 [Puccinia coronata f. sp. avenae]